MVGQDTRNTPAQLPYGLMQGHLYLNRSDIYTILPKPDYYSQ